MTNLGRLRDARQPKEVGLAAMEELPIPSLQMRYDPWITAAADRLDEGADITRSGRMHDR